MSKLETARRLAKQTAEQEAYTGTIVSVTVAKAIKTFLKGCSALKVNIFNKFSNR